MSEELEKFKRNAGPTTRRLIEALEEEMERQGGFDGPADRLEDLSRALLEVARELREPLPWKAFRHMNPDHLRTMENILLSYGMSVELLNASREIDAEAN